MDLVAKLSLVGLMVNADRVYDNDDRFYRLFLRACLERRSQLNQEENRKAEREAKKRA